MKKEESVYETKNKKISTKFKVYCTHCKQVVEIPKDKELLKELKGYVEEGKEPVSLHEGSVVFIKPEVKHWHGAKKDSYFSHVAVEVPGENTSNEWLEAVSDDEYAKLA